MTTIAAHQTRDNSRFHTVAAPFPQDDGLPFAEVLSAEAIEPQTSRIQHPGPAPTDPRLR
jgi:hypothetical protein